MLKFFYLFVAVLIVLSSNLTLATVIHVPENAATIQAGIDMAEQGDTVLVDEGLYYENIKFKGKSIVVTSKFILDHNPDYILNTIINGSQATNQDSASCVMFYGEDSSAVLQGFTLTEGRGTIYTLSDLSTTTSYDGMITVEGGGIFFNESHATVKNNLIINNQAAAISGYNYNGGGGISTFCGNPKIYNNVIMKNKAVSAHNTYGYAAGVVFNESHGVVRNNIIYDNTTTGRGTLFFDINKSVIVENNTVVGNVCSRDAAGIFNRTPNSVFRNNIVWGNIDNNNQIMGLGTDDIFEYCFTEQNLADRTGIFNAYPEFSDSNFILYPYSPCVDAGNPDTAFNEIDDYSNPGYAVPPSLGETRNDIGAYGGPYADILPDFHNENVKVPSMLSFPNTTVNENGIKEISLFNISTVSLTIDSITFINKNELSLGDSIISSCKPLQTCIIEVFWTPLQSGDMNDTVKIFHSLKDVTNPVIVKIRGTAVEATGISDEQNKPVPMQFNLRQNFPNPFNPATKIQYSIPDQEFVSLKIFDMLGRELNTLVDGMQNAGNYEVFLDGTHLSAGIYIYSLKAGRYSDQKKLVLLK